MIEEVIGEVRLRVRTDLADTGQVRAIAERTVRAALERCAALLEARAPGRVVLIRRLPLRWRLDEAVLDDPEVVEELARSAADEIERLTYPQTLEPPAAYEGAVVFDGEPELRASHLVALARGRPAWFHESLEQPSAGDPLAALAAPERRATAQATLLILARAGVLAEVLASRPSAVVEVLATTLGLATVPPTGSLPGPSPPAVAALAGIASQWPRLAAVPRTLALRAHAAVALDVAPDAPAAGSLAAAVLSSQQAHRVVEEQPSVVSFTERETIEERRVVPEPSRVEEAAPAPESETATRLVATRCAGLFYLLDRVQELDIAESLWKACLPEGRVLAAAAAELLGKPFKSDPAPALFGGVDRRRACPDVTTEQCAEVAAQTCAALAAALPRRGLSDIPPARLALVDRSNGRVLAASADGYPFAFFAWPADSPESLRAGLRALLDAWPHRGALTASPALAALDGSGRVRTRIDASETTLLLPEASSAAATALLAVVAGAPCTLIAARVHAAKIETPAAFVERFLARAGRVRIGSGTMDVLLDGKEIDLDLRSAGLDRDPGWLPWMRRTVRMEFAVEEA